jgi:hypothetical protein
MTLGIGQKLGHYEITAPIGAGGMGEVYRARDTILNRSVAIKVLPVTHDEDEEGWRRFEREAQAISSLNHPNICTVHDFGEHNGARYMVMEYLEGQTLAQRLVKGPLPLGELLSCAAQIAAALDQAHRRGLIHRDLKPAQHYANQVRSQAAGLRARPGGQRPVDGDHRDVGPHCQRQRPGHISVHVARAGAGPRD